MHSKKVHYAAACFYHQRLEERNDCVDLVREPRTRAREKFAPLCATQSSFISGKFYAAAWCYQQRLEKRNDCVELVRELRTKARRF